MKKFFSLVILLGVISLVSCATEQKEIQTSTLPGERCDAPVWNVGDSWRWEGPNYYHMEVRITNKDGDFYIIEELSNAGKYIVKFDKKTLQFTHWKTSKGANLATWGTRLPYGEQTDIRFPIYVGKKWSFQGLGYVESKVVSYENVTIPAGTFKAFRIDCFNIIRDLMGSYWYCPKLKTSIKAFSNVKGFTISELVSYRIKDE